VVNRTYKRRATAAGVARQTASGQCREDDLPLGSPKAMASDCAEIVVWLLDLKPSMLSFSKKLNDKSEKLKIWQYLRLDIGEPTFTSEIMIMRLVDKRAMSWTLCRLIKDRSGVTAIEYGLIAALIAVAAVVVMGTVGTNLSSTFNTVAGSL
jgi:pilus assembly protein Flp/PilA